MSEAMGGGDGGEVIGGFGEGAGAIAVPLWGTLSRIRGGGIHRRGMGCGQRNGDSSGGVAVVLVLVRVLVRVSLRVRVGLVVMVVVVVERVRVRGERAR